MSIGINVCSFSGLRVAGQLTYVPAHFRNGKPISACLTIPVMANSKTRSGEGRTDSYKLTAWGGAADALARGCSPGKELDITGEAQSYLGTLFNQDGSVRLDNTGQPIQTTKVGFTIEKFKFGNDSSKRINDEIANGDRPPMWNVPGHPDAALWDQKKAHRNAATWKTGMTAFGFARVIIPQGQGISMTPPAGYVAAGQGQFVGNYGQPAGSLPGAVAAVANGMPASGGVPPQGTYVAGVF